ncbi:MAG: Molybdenum transport system permease protein ModB [Gammaproteobacteria bacterium]|nr:Molybdenum transport system permease protein ModB [Gammaproteobacteria bacterium]
MGHDELQALRLSLQVAICSVLAGMPLALVVASVLARCRFPGKALVDALIHLPLVVPPVVTGYLLLLLLGRHGIVGAWLYEQFDIVFAFRWTGAVIAAMVMSFPLMVRPIRLSMENVDRRLEDAARTLGASPARVFLSVTLPLAIPGIVVAALLGFARSLGEFGATITFVGNIPGETRTLSSAIYTFMQTPEGDRSALHLAIVSLGISLLALVASEYCARRAQAVVHGI